MEDTIVIAGLMGFMSFIIHPALTMYQKDKDTYIIQIINNAANVALLLLGVD